MLDEAENGGDRLHRLRHSAAHVMAQAVLEMFPAAKLAIGPAIEDGFYYDFDLPRALTPEDLQKIEVRIKEIVNEDLPFQYREISEQEAREIFKDQPYKLELISRILAEGTDEYGEKTGERPKLSVYRHGLFVDLCRGPHVENVHDISPEALRLLSVAGAYWRGDANRPMLQRIYGTAWATPSDLQKFITMREEALKRDHRKLGPELELFHLDETAPGMPYWLPKGLRFINTLLGFWREEHEKRGYQEISTPLVNNKRLWETSGHWAHYQDNMFVIPIDEYNTYAVKPMNCPNAMIVYRLKKRSYRDLPLRLSDCDVLHRNERSGTLHGLLRVQEFRQDDSHNFITEDQIENEYQRILDIADLFYSVFGLKYKARLSTRPADYMGDAITWDKAEDALRRVLDNRFGLGNYAVLDGEGAFYGPKVDIMMDDALGRQWQMGTLQLDFQLPRRFELTYTDENGQEQTPVVVHRVIYGSIERFVGILIEQFAGAFPFWIAPVQAVLIPIADRHIAYAEQIGEKLKEAGIRYELDGRKERMNAKIRDAQLQKIPYMLVIGDREQALNVVAIRTRTNKDLGKVDLDAFLAGCKMLAKQRTLELAETF